MLKLEQHLSNLCLKNPEYNDLMATWNINKRAYAEALVVVEQNYPHYTEHGRSHSESIITNIELLLGEERIEQLSPTDTWMILQAAYLHDLGMTLQESMLQEDWESAEFQAYLAELEQSGDDYLREAAQYLAKLKDELQRDSFEKNWPLQIRKYVTVIISDYYRRRHGALSENYVLHLEEKLGISLGFQGLIQTRLVVLLGRISCLHTEDGEEVMKLDYRSNGHNADYIHPRMIAELIRVGDILDLDNNRYNPYLHRAFGRMPESSAVHVRKHESTRHILITPERIEFRADCKDMRAFRETRSFLDWLNREMDFMVRNWTQLMPAGFKGSAPKVGETKVFLNGKEDLNGTADLRFSISQEKAFDIIEGSNLYQEDYIFLRELIQNASDACKIQMWRDLKAGKYMAWIEGGKASAGMMPNEIDPQVFQNYQIVVDLKRIGDKMRVTVSDNGTGISVDALKKMCEVGNSYHEREKLRKEIEEMPRWLRPTAGFGIGLQSVFLETESFRILSNCQGEVIEAIVESRKKDGYVQISASDEEREQQGTDIIVDLDWKEQMSFQLGGNVYQYLEEKYDPFGEENRMMYYKLLDVLSNHCESSYFPIRVRIPGDGEVKLENQIAFEEEKKWTEGERYRYHLDENGVFMKMWDKQTQNRILFELNSPGVGNGEACFRGMNVRSAGFQYSGLNFKADLYGMETRGSLALNRNELTKKAKRELRMILDDAFDFYIRCVWEKFEEMEEEEFGETWGGEQKEGKLLSLWRYLDKEEKGRALSKYKSRFAQFGEIVEVIRIDQETKSADYKKISFLDFVENLNVTGYPTDVERLEYLEEPEKEKAREKLRVCMERNLEKLQVKYILTGRMIFRCIEKYPVCRVQILDDGEEILCQLGEENENGCIQMSEEDRKAFLKEALGIGRITGFSHSWLRERIRTALAANEKYPELAVRECDSVLIVGESYQQTGMMILPILRTDHKNVKIMAKEAFAEAIMKRKDFENLVNFVSEKQWIPGKYEKETIRESYKKLIEECYDLLKEEMK
ncbi:MAG: hypothetical protein Q4F41_09595 [Eubacteriales bacterium]|nr:hypothetical protein [Eubacteriales bacterium]